MTMRACRGIKIFYNLKAKPSTKKGVPFISFTFNLLFLPGGNGTSGKVEIGTAAVYTGRVIIKINVAAHFDVVA